MKYDKKLAQQLAGAVATGKHTVEDICRAHKIAPSTFYKWKAEKSEFSEALKKAEASRRESLRDRALSGLAKLLDVHELEETTTEYIDDGKGKPKLKLRRVTKRQVMPSALAVIFAAKNLESEHFKDKQELEHSGSISGVRVTIEQGKERSRG